MSSRLERQGVWKRRALVGALFVLLAIGGMRASTAGHVPAARKEPSPLPMTVCPAAKVAVEPADVGTGDSVRCLPLGDADVQGSRVDPLYSRVAAELIERISGDATGAGDVKVVCWSEDDWRAFSASFADDGRYWLGWAPRGRTTINLSSLACMQLDRIAYMHADLALEATGAAVGTLAHETVHVAGFAEEGVADCYGMQLADVAALGLGADSAYADKLQELNVEFLEERHSGTEYDSPDCYDGGPLDLAPDGPRWP